MDPDGVIDSNWDEVTENFDDMNLREELLRGVYAYGFEKPSAIQQRAIVPCVKGHDVIAQAQSGTGKTATFSISILQQIDTKLAQCQVRRYKKFEIMLLLSIKYLDYIYLTRNVLYVLGSSFGTHQRVGSTNPEGSYCIGRLHGSTMPRLHWRNLCS